MDLSDALRARIQELLKGRQWSQKDLAERLGVTQPSVSQLLKGRRRRRGINLWNEIAGVFDYTLSDLIAEAEARFATPITAQDNSSLAQGTAQPTTPPRRRERPERYRHLP